MPQIISKGGPPALGNQSFALNVRNAPAGATGVLLLGFFPTSIPFLGCTLLTLPLAQVPVAVGPDLPFPISCNANAIGVSLFLQWIILDPGGPFSASNGLWIVL